MKSDKIKKLNFKTDEVLSRSEMKQILGGYGDGGSCSCQVGQACSLWDGSTSWAGECAADWGGGSGTLIPCGCSTNYGVYIPTSVQSHCCT
jgi:natural product precursor